LQVQAVRRDDEIPHVNLGHVVYCIGLTADWRSRPFETVDAHVCTLLDLIKTHHFDSLLYLSSTRVYAGADSTEEDKPLRVNPQDWNDLYNISKITGESITLNCGRTGRVARVSNVYGPDFTSDNFLPGILRQAVNGEKIVLRTAPGSEKDYVWVHEVVEQLIFIATGGKQRIYNIASGMNVSNRQLAEKLYELTGCEIEFQPDAPEIKFPPININRARREFGFLMSSVLKDLPWLVQLYKEQCSAQ
jgi:nucleoside-diphosphate-sugar epimerase